jgi:dipeptidyl aminopeptidase/acylaminoacyl peptidase
MLSTNRLIMNSHELVRTLFMFFILLGCSPTATTPIIQASSPETNVTATTPPAPSVTLAPDFPDGCINLTETLLYTKELNGLFVVYDFDNNNFYFLDPKANQILSIEEKKQISLVASENDNISVWISPNKKFIQVSPIYKNYAITRTIDKIIKTSDTQGQEDWNRGRWLDNEHMFFQHWLVPDGNTIVIYNPFTGEESNKQLDLPNPYVVVDGGGTISWVRADIDPSLTRVLYNDNDGRLVLWDLDIKKEIASLPAPTDLGEGKWSSDGREFAMPLPSSSSAATELFTIDMNGIVKKLTNFNQTYSFANIDARPSWSPDGRQIAFWLKVSNLANPDPDDLRQWLAITNTTTLNTQIYCLSPNKPPTHGEDIIWSSDSQQLIVNTEVLSEEVKPILVDLTHQTQSKLDTHGLWVDDWMAP